MRPHLRYLSYVLRHKWFVLVAGLRVGAPLWRLLIHDWSKFLPAEWGPYVATFYGGRFAVGAIVEIHSPEGVHGQAEVLEIRRYEAQAARGLKTVGATRRVRMVDRNPAPDFWAWDYEVDGLCDQQDRFDRAWLHHYRLNPHHWEAWLLHLDGEPVALAMPEPLVREMVADWMGAGRAVTGRWEAQEWYRRQRDRITLHPDTRRIAERLLGLNYDGRADTWTPSRKGVA